jgi:nitroreductase
VAWAKRWGARSHAGDQSTGAMASTGGRGTRAAVGATTVLEVDLGQALRTTGAAREFLDREVPDEVVHRLLDTARFAPNGGNRQAWRVIVVKDPDLKRGMRDIYLPGWYEYLAQVGAGLTPWGVLSDRRAEERAVADAPRIAATSADGPGGFAEHFDQVPVMLVLLADLAKLATVDRDADGYTMVGGASIYPFAWSVLLAARDEGLAGVMTTMVVRDATAVRQLLGIPDQLTVAAVLALGQPERQPTRLRRDPVGHFATLDRYDGSPLGAG